MVPHPPTHTSNAVGELAGNSYKVVMYKSFGEKTLACLLAWLQSPTIAAVCNHTTGLPHTKSHTTSLPLHLTMNILMDFFKDVHQPEGETVSITALQ